MKSTIIMSVLMAAISVNAFGADLSAPKCPQGSEAVAVEQEASAPVKKEEGVAVNVIDGDASAPKSK